MRIAATVIQVALQHARKIYIEHFKCFCRATTMPVFSQAGAQKKPISPLTPGLLQWIHLFQVLQAPYLQVLSICQRA